MTIFRYIIRTIHVSQSVEGKANDRWVARSDFALVFNFSSIVEFNNAFLQQILQIFTNFKTVVAIKFLNPFILMNIARCPMPP